MDESERLKVSPSRTVEVTKSAQPEMLVESSLLEVDACDIEELRRMNFVTVDEVGEDEGAKQEQLVEDAKEKKPITRRVGRPKKKTLQAPGQCLFNF